MQSLLTLVLIIATVCDGSATYNADDAWRQMSGLTDYSATFSAITTYEGVTSSPISSRSADSKAAASSYGGGGGYGGGSYGGGSYGGGGYGHGAASYGGAHGGGYGHGGSNSGNAVALLGLLLLINLLRDILNQVTTTAAATGRKRKSISDPFHEWFSNLGNGGIETLTYEVAATVLPLLSDFTEHHDLRRPLVCTQRSVCSANRRLASNYGQVGKVFGKLGSEAVLEHFQTFYAEGTFTEAAIHGRNLEDCYKIYSECKLE